MWAKKFMTHKGKNQFKMDVFLSEDICYDNEENHYYNRGEIFYIKDPERLQFKARISKGDFLEGVFHSPCVCQKQAYKKGTDSYP